jgi:hypothetical protein
VPLNECGQGRFVATIDEAAEQFAVSHLRITAGCHPAKVFD